MARYLGGIVPLLLGIALLVYSLSLSLGTLSQPGPGLWPFIASLVVCLSSIVLLITERDSEDYESITSGAKIVGLGVLSLILFIPLFEFTGFVIPALLLMIFWLRYLGSESWRLTLLTSVSCVTGFYVLFGLILQIPFPEDLLASILGL